MKSYMPHGTYLRIIFYLYNTLQYVWVLVFPNNTIIFKVVTGVMLAKFHRVVSSHVKVCKSAFEIQYIINLT